jgi:hypothetical protein
VSGYTPVFKSVFTGTLFGKYPDLPLWLVLLAMADKNGVVDAHPGYISASCGIHQDEVEDCIRRFCEPDPSSRTPDDDGRRLRPLEGKGFGWCIVNHGKYRERARKQAWDAERTASGRDAERKRQERVNVPTCPDVSRLSPLSDSDANTNTDKNLPTGGARKRATRRCPDDWKPSPEDVAKISRECPDVDMAAAERKFRDHEFAKARSDWAACWRNWMRSDQERAGKGNKPRLTRYEELMARAKLPAPAEPSAVALFLAGGKL